MIQQASDAALVFNDFQGLNSIRQQDDSDALYAVSKQFESVFLKLVLKSMRDANAAFEEGSLFSSNQSKFYQQMFDDQLSLTLSSGQGTGLADVLYRQLSRQLPGDFDGDGSGLAPKTLADYNRNLAKVSGTQALENTVDRLVEDLRRSTATRADDNATPNIEPQRFDTPEAFVEYLYPIAESIAADTGLDPRALVAQAALETGWGAKPITRADGQSSFNLFAIKADHRWAGDSTRIATTEFRAGEAQAERADFRVYGSYEESFRDYADFVKSSPRYQDAVEQAADGEAYIHGLQRAGYATDPAYGSKITNIMNSERFNEAVGRASG